MTTLKITVEDEQVDLLRKLLQETSFVKKIEEESSSTDVSELSQTNHIKIKSILEKAKGKNLFADITDPSEWQREIRKEWDRDF